MADLKALKRVNAIADVISETGHPLVYDPKKSVWNGRDNSSLEVDPEKNCYSWGSESGDVFDWLIKRFGWSFGQVIHFLENRSMLPEKGRIKLVPDLVAIEKVKIHPDGPGNWIEDVEPKSQEVALKDRRVREALRLGVDYPGSGMLRFVGLSPFAIFRECSWLPYQFVGIVGLLVDEACSLCGKDFLGWQDQGQAFQAVEVLGDKSFLIPETYCSRCLNKVQRWRRAFNQLGRWKMEQERNLEKSKLTSESMAILEVD